MGYRKAWRFGYSRVWATLPTHRDTAGGTACVDIQLASRHGAPTGPR